MICSNQGYKETHLIYTFNFIIMNTTFFICYAEKYQQSLSSFNQEDYLFTDY